MNIISVVGNLAKDCVVREKDGDNFVAFTVCNNIYQGEGKEDIVNYFDVFWKVKRTDKLVDIFKKGSKVTVHGECVIRKTERDGVNYTNVQIRYPKVDLPAKLSSDKDGDKSQKGKDDLDDDIPF
jgi:single-stranded DNA-binding protein